MGEAQFYDDKVLFDSGQVAMHADCCCVWSRSCGDCNCGLDDLAVTAVITSNKEPFPPDPVDLETCVASETIEDTDTTWGNCFWIGERTAVGCSEIAGVANWGAVVGFTVYTWREEYQVWSSTTRCSSR